MKSGTPAFFGCPSANKSASGHDFGTFNMKFGGKHGWFWNLELPISGKFSIADHANSSLWTLPAWRRLLLVPSFSTGCGVRVKCVQYLPTTVPWGGRWYIYLGGLTAWVWGKTTKTQNQLIRSGCWIGRQAKLPMHGYGYVEGKCGVMIPLTAGLTEETMAAAFRDCMVNWRLRSEPPGRGSSRPGRFLPQRMPVRARGICYGVLSYPLFSRTKV